MYASHKEAASFVRLTIPDDVAGISSEPLKISGVYGWSWYWRNRGGYSVAISVEWISWCVPVLGPLLLQVRQWFDEHYRHVYVDLAISIGLGCVNGLLVADRRVRPCDCRGKYVNPMLPQYSTPSDIIQLPYIYVLLRKKK